MTPSNVGVFERMILDLHGQRLHRRVEARPLRHGPAFERAVVLQAEVVVQPAGGVLLNDELPAGRVLRASAGRLRRAAEIALAFVFFEAHAMASRPQSSNGFGRISLLHAG